MLNLVLVLSMALLMFTRMLMLPKKMAMLLLEITQITSRTIAIRKAKSICYCKSTSEVKSTSKIESNNIHRYYGQ